MTRFHHFDFHRNIIIIISCAIKLMFLWINKGFKNKNITLWISYCWWLVTTLALLEYAILLAPTEGIAGILGGSEKLFSSILENNDMLSLLDIVNNCSTATEMMSSLTKSCLGMNESLFDLFKQKWLKWPWSVWDGRL